MKFNSPIMYLDHGRLGKRCDGDGFRVVEKWVSTGDKGVVSIVVGIRKSHDE